MLVPRPYSRMIRSRRLTRPALGRYNFLSAKRIEGRKCACRRRLRSAGRPDCGGHGFAPRLTLRFCSSAITQTERLLRLDCQPAALVRAANLNEIQEKAMIKATQLRPGMIIKHEGDLHVVYSVDHRTPGNKRGSMQTKMRNLRS